MLSDSSFSVEFTITNRELNEGYLFFVLNGIKMGNRLFDYNLPIAIEKYIEEFRIPKKSCSPELFKLSKEDIIKVYDCICCDIWGPSEAELSANFSYEEDYHRLNQFTKEFDHCDVVITPQYYNFDHHTLYHLSSKEFERVIIESNSGEVEEVLLRKGKIISSLLKAQEKYNSVVKNES